MSKLGTGLALALLVAVLAAGCGGGSGGDRSDDGNGTLPAAVWGDSNWGEAVWQ